MFSPIYVCRREVSQAAALDSKIGGSSLRKRTISIFIFIGSVILMSLFSNSCSNLLSKIMDDGFFVPKESNIHSFKVVKMNTGSGDWWVVGEDKNYIFIMAEEPPWGYYIVRKSSTKLDFSYLDKTSWGKNYEFIRLEE